MSHGLHPLRLVCLALALLVAACSEGGDSEEGDPRDDEDAGEDDSRDGARDTARDTSADAGFGARPDAAVKRDAAASQSLDASAEPARDASRAADSRDARASSPDAQTADAGCQHHGGLSYKLARASQPTSAQTAAYGRITQAMDRALQKYNCYADFARELSVTYDTGVATADGNENGSIRFGSDASMNFVTAMHETAHTLGVGGNAFRQQVSNGSFTGPRATAKLRAITKLADDVVHSDGTHFWPYGLNYETEYKSEADAVAHCELVTAIRQDLGY